MIRSYSISSNDVKDWDGNEKVEIFKRDVNAHHQQRKRDFSSTIFKYQLDASSFLFQFKLFNMYKIIIINKRNDENCKNVECFIRMKYEEKHKCFV